MKHSRVKPSPCTHLYAAIALLMLSAWAFPYFPQLGSPNELTRLYLTRAMVDDGSFSIDSQVRKYGPLTDMSKFNGSLYTDKAPGASMLAIAVYSMLKLFHAWQGQRVSNRLLLRWLRIVISGLSAALTMLLLLNLLKDMGLDTDRRMLMAWAWALGTVAFPYAGLFYGHGLCALWLTAAFWTLNKMSKSSTPPWIPAAAGATLGAAILTEYTSILLVAPLGVACAWLSRKKPRNLLLAVLGASIPLGILALYHQACFGAPWATGYAHLASRHYAQVHAQGFMGLVSPSFQRLWKILFGTTRGLLFYSPWLMLGPLGIVMTILRMVPTQTKSRPIWIAIGISIILYLLFAMSLKIDAWGWSLGPRHLTPLVPFLTLGAASLLRGNKTHIHSSSFVFAWAVPYSVIATTIPFVVFGGFPPDFSNPLADFITPLLAQGCVAPNFGKQIGLPAWAGLIPFYLAQAGILVWMFKILHQRSWLKYATLVISLLAVLCAFGIRGKNPPKEDRAYNWVTHDIIKCIPSEGNRHRK